MIRIVKNVKLLPCPCCGHRAYLKQFGRGTYYVRCANDDCLMFTAVGRKAVVIRRWNERVKP